MKPKNFFILTIVVSLIIALLALTPGQPAAAGSAMSPVGVNIALNTSRTGYPNPLGSNNGWGCCPDKWAMVDGSIAAPSWSYGFAWGGGTRHWNGESCGWKQATIDFGELKTFHRTVTYHHGQGHVPTEYKIQYWDGLIWQDIVSVTDNAKCQEGDPDYADNCPLDDTFSSVTASKVRYTFDQNCEITDGSDWRYVEHGWIREFEVYGYTYVNQPPVADAGGPYALNEGGTITLDASGSTDPDDNIVLYEWDVDNDGVYSDGTGVTIDRSYADDGDYTVSLKVTDEYNESDTDTAEITVANVAPDIETLAVPSEPVQVGVSVGTTATFTDPGILDTYVATWDWGDGITSEGVVDGYGVNGSHVFDTPGVYTLTLTVEDDDGGVDSAIFQYVVIYDPDGGFVTGGGWIDSLAGAYYPSDLPFLDGSYYEIILSETPFTWFEARDAATGMTKANCASAHLATITSQEEYNKVLELFSEYPGALLGGFQEEGVSPADVGWQWVTGEPFTFTAWLPGEPNDSPWGVYGDAAEQQLEMYPTGWNDVPGFESRNTFVIEYEDCDLLTGKATFGFVSKYKKGATVPTGNTEFQFHVADLNFKSTAYDWLVIAGTKAQYKGTGTINGIGEYKFMLTAIDGSPDRFRIKIWDAQTEVVIYDNMLGMEDTADPATALQGGSIVIHKAK